MDRVRCVAWDFDGVLNRNVVDGRFPWMDRMAARFEVDRDVFWRTVFSGNYRPVMNGRVDLLDHLEEWKAEVGFGGDVEEIVHFWFHDDAVPCGNLLTLMDRLNSAGVRQVIATNNEDRRSSFIENEMGYSRRIERLFSSGRMKVAKPDAGYFRHIEEVLGLAPHQLLLVDDQPENIVGADACGWQVHHFAEDGHQELSDRLAHIL